MPGFDWNGNGKSDSFDGFMDMKLSGSLKNSRTAASGKKKRNGGEPKGISMGGKPLYDSKKDSDGVTILKCFLVTFLCIGGIILPFATDMGTLETLLCIFGGIGLSIAILKNV